MFYGIIVLLYYLITRSTICRIFMSNTVAKKPLLRLQMVSLSKAL